MPSQLDAKIYGLTFKLYENKPEIESVASSRQHRVCLASSWRHRVRPFSVFKAETWQTTPSANNPDETAAHNVIRHNPGPTRFAKYQCSEVSDTFALFLRCFLQKITFQLTNGKRAIAYSSSWKPVDDKEFKAFYDVIILTGVYKFNNESIARLWSTLDGHFQSHYK